MGHCVDLAFGEIRDNAQGSYRVAVQCAVAHGGLALVDGGEHKAFRAVCQGGHDGAADALLQLRAGRVGNAQGKVLHGLGHCPLVLCHEPVNAYDRDLDAQGVGKLQGSCHSVRTCLRRGHDDGRDVVRAKGFHGNGKH